MPQRERFGRLHPPNRFANKITLGADEIRATDAEAAQQLFARLDKFGE